MDNSVGKMILFCFYNCVKLPCILFYFHLPPPTPSHPHSEVFIVRSTIFTTDYFRWSSAYSNIPGVKLWSPAVTSPTMMCCLVKRILSSGLLFSLTFVSPFSINSNCNFNAHYYITLHFSCHSIVETLDKQELDLIGSSSVSTFSLSLCFRNNI